MNRCNGLFMHLNRRSKDLDLHTLPQVLCHHTRVAAVGVVGTLRDPNLHQVVGVGAAVVEGEEELVQVQDQTTTRPGWIFCLAAQPRRRPQLRSRLRRRLLSRGRGLVVV